MVRIIRATLALSDKENMLGLSADDDVDDDDEEEEDSDDDDDDDGTTWREGSRQ